MGEDSQSSAPAHYRAFISYSHTDARFAGWLHRKLEAWSLPGQTRLSPVFIDRAELAAGPDLSAQVRAALAASSALIVVASPAARASRWVAQEISLYRELHPDRPVLAALIEGEPVAAFPDPLLSHGGMALEPLAADFREGHDGKRLALLKIVAGLTALPLDRLVQRDAQSRQRRVMAVTAGAVLLSLILAAALIIALRARTEAEHQRAEAEGMVEFMLTDLRDKLKGVGRLDVMQTVNERAMRYYGNQGDLSRLQPDSLLRRARVIEAIGEDDENSGKPDAAIAKYRELYRITRALLNSDQANPNRIFAHAESENRLALTETSQGHLAAAYVRFKDAAQLLHRLPSENQKPAWLALRSLVAGNLCAIGIKAGQNAAEAVRNCEAAVALAQEHLALASADGSAQYDLAFHYLWLGEAWQAHGNPANAARARTLGLQVSTELVASEPDNMAWLEQHMEVCFSLARIAREGGDQVRSRSLLDLASSDAARLVRHDQSNHYWADYQVKIATLKKEIL